MSAPAPGRARPLRSIARLRSSVALLALAGAACEPAPTTTMMPPVACKRVSITLPQGDSGVPISDGGVAGHVHPSSPVPDIYLNALNPYGYTDPTLGKLGAPAYATYCARCHGADGQGCGPDAANLNPPPTNLNDANRLHDDPYLDWRIHVGGDLPGFMTAMPAFDKVLSDDEIWQIITYIRWQFVDYE